MAQYSRMGGYHGKASFDVFSHPKPVVKMQITKRSFNSEFETILLIRRFLEIISKELVMWWDFGVVSDIFVTVSLRFPSLSLFSKIRKDVQILFLSDSVKLGVWELIN